MVLDHKSRPKSQKTQTTYVSGYRESAQCHIQQHVQRIMYSKLKVDYATFSIDSAVMIYGFNIENKKFKLLNFIVNCAMFVIYKCIIVRNFEGKQYSFRRVTKYVTSRTKRSNL